MVRRSALVLVAALLSASLPAAQTGPSRANEAGRGVAGTATLTGTVESSTPYNAAQVFIRNTDTRMLYMVYTSAKRFRAVALFPGTYEISAATADLKSDVQKLTIKAGESPKVTLAFAQPRSAAERAIVNANEGETQGTSRVRVEASYDEIYPAGPGRDIAERTCMVCHGENFISTQPATVGTWNLRLDRMMGKNLFDKPPSSYAEGLLTYRASELRFSREDRETLVKYLAENFGPDKQPRAVRIDKELPLDEAKLGKAEFIEYYLTPDPPGQGINAPEFAKLKGQFVGRRVGQDVRFDAEGNVWLTDRGYPNRLVKLDPRTGVQKSYVLPDPKNGNHDVNIDRTGMVWLAEAEGQQPGAEKHLLGFNPKTEKFEYIVPMDPDHVLRNPLKWLQSIAFDSQNNVYVGWIMGGAIAKFDRATKKVTVFPIPQHNAIPYGIIADRNDNMWIALWDSGNIAKFDTHNNQFTIFAPPTYPSQIRRLNVDAQNNIWFGMWSAGNRPGKLGRLDQTTGRITEYNVPRRNANPYDVSQDPEGNIWVADVGGSAASLYKFNPRDQSFTLYPKPQKSADTPKIQITKDGAIWYAPRGSQDAPAFGVLYPDMDRITSLAALYVNGPPGYPFKVQQTSSTASPASGVVGTQGRRSLPTFEVDRSWPKVPAKWKLGDSSSFAIDAKDNVWLLHRPRTLLKPEDVPKRAPAVMVFDTAGNNIKSWGGEAAGYEWPQREHGINVDAKGFVWITGNNCPTNGIAGLKPVADDQILKFTQDGKFVMQIGRSNQSKGNADTMNVHRAADVQYWPRTNELLVADGYGNHRVIVFDADSGKFKRMWGAFGNKPMDDDHCEVVTPKSFPPGDGPSNFSIVHAIRVAKDGTVYVADRENRRVQVFTLDGKFVKQLVKTDTPFARNLAFSADPMQQFLYVGDGDDIVIVDRATMQIAGSIKLPGQIGGGHHIATDSKGNIYIAGTTMGLQKLTYKGMSPTSTQ